MNIRKNEGTVATRDFATKKLGDYVIADVEKITILWGSGNDKAI
jgi:hypothetical protein